MQDRFGITATSRSKPSVWPGRRTVACKLSRRDTCLIGFVALTGEAAQVRQAVASEQQLLQQVPAAADEVLHTLSATSATPGTAAAAGTGNSAVQSSATCSAQLDTGLAAAFIEAVYSTAKQQQIVPEQQLQVERYKLQTQEYKYYAAANQDKMPTLPYLEDSSGGLSNRTYYNFVSYVLWKVIARHLPTPEARTAFCSAVGQQLLEQLAPDTLAAVKQAAAAAGPVKQAPASAIVPAVQSLLGQLQERGYICASQLVWGSQPGGWPADWAVSQQQLVGEEDLQAAPGPLQPGSIFQVKLQQPADIEGSVALRAEEDGFWSRHVSSMLAALLAAGGYSTAAVDEYFYQDYWSGPSKPADKLLLLFGDPLQQVDVPWTPTTLVQNWGV